MADLGGCLCVLAVLGAVAVLIGYFSKRGKVSRNGGQALAPIPGPQGDLARLSASIIPMMQRFGRYSLAPHLSTDTDIYSDVVVPLYHLAQADPAGFVVWLRDQVLPVGGWPVFGAARVLWETLESDFSHPARTELIDAGLQFLRDRGAPNTMVTGYEWRHWVDGKGKSEAWLVGRPKPSPEEAPITDLANGELRRIVQVFPEPNSNIILVRRQGDGYTAVVDARWSDDDPRRVQSDFKHAPTLNDLYWEVGCALQTPGHWSHPEMQPYFPLPRPRFD